MVIVFLVQPRTDPLTGTLLHCFGMPQVVNKATRNFASDNNAGVHPEVIEAIARANLGHVVAYGDDPFTRSAVARAERMATSRQRRRNLSLTIVGTVSLTRVPPGDWKRNCNCFRGARKKS